jgi:hypothetical protein
VATGAKQGSTRTTFLIGMLLTLPGGSYLAGLDQINKLNYSTTVTVLLVIGFNLVMLWLLAPSIAIPIGFVAYADHVHQSTAINWLGALVAVSLVLAASVLANRR